MCDDAKAETGSMSTLVNELLSAGFDVCKPMNVAWYNDYLKELGLATDSTSCMIHVNLVPPDS